MVRKSILFILFISCPLNAGNMVTLKNIKRYPKYPSLYYGIVKLVIGSLMIIPTACNIQPMIKKFNIYKRESEAYHKERPAFKAFKEEPKEPSVIKEGILLPLNLTVWGLLWYEGITEICESVKGTTCHEPDTHPLNSSSSSSN